jgi:hypothetical protein
MARARNGRFGKAIDERVDVGAVLRKGAHDKRLYTSELTQIEESTSTTARWPRGLAQALQRAAWPPAATEGLTGGGEGARGE